MNTHPMPSNVVRLTTLIILSLCFMAMPVAEAVAGQICKGSICLKHKQNNIAIINDGKTIKKAKLGSQVVDVFSTDFAFLIVTVSDAYLVSFHGKLHGKQPFPYKATSAKETGGHIFVIFENNKIIELFSDNKSLRSRQVEQDSNDAIVFIFHDKQGHQTRFTNNKLFTEERNSNIVILDQGPDFIYYIDTLGRRIFADNVRHTLTEAVRPIKRISDWNLFGKIFSKVDSKTRQSLIANLVNSRARHVALRQFIPLEVTNFQTYPDFNFIESFYNEFSAKQVGEIVDLLSKAPGVKKWYLSMGLNSDNELKSIERHFSSFLKSREYVHLVRPLAGEPIFHIGHSFHDTTGQMHLSVQFKPVGSILSAHAGSLCKLKKTYTTTKKTWRMALVVPVGEITSKYEVHEYECTPNKRFLDGVVRSRALFTRAGLHSDLKGLADSYVGKKETYLEDVAYKSFTPEAGSSGSTNGFGRATFISSNDRTIGSIDARSGIGDTLNISVRGVDPSDKHLVHVSAQSRLETKNQSNDDDFSFWFPVTDYPLKVTVKAKIFCATVSSCHKKDIRITFKVNSPGTHVYVP